MGGGVRIQRSILVIDCILQDCSLPGGPETFGLLPQGGEVREIRMIIPILWMQVCGGLAGAAVRAEGIGSSNQLQGSKSETFAMLGAVNIYCCS